MRKFVIVISLVFLFLNTGYSQAVISYLPCAPEKAHPYTPAPCEITGNGEQTTLFMIQVGAYANWINPKSGTIMIQTLINNGGVESYMHRYYIAAIFPSEQEAQAFMIQNRVKEPAPAGMGYCDAQVVVFPFVGVVGYVTPKGYTAPTSAANGRY